MRQYIVDCTMSNTHIMYVNDIRQLEIHTLPI